MEETSAIQCSLFVFHFFLSNPRPIFSFYLVLGTNISLPAKISLAYLTYRVSSPMVPKFSASILSSVPGGKLHETVVPRSHASNYRSQTSWLFTVPDWTQTLSLRPYLNPWGALQPSVLPLWLESCDTLALYDPRIVHTSSQMILRIANGPCYELARSPAAWPNRVIRSLYHYAQ